MADERIPEPGEEPGTPPPTPGPAPSSLTRRPAFWVALVLLAAGSVTFALRYFAEAFPVAGIQLEMDREGALVQARALADRHGWGPEGFRQAATFTDPEPQVRTYVELEAGEDDSLTRLREEAGYHPYRWEVRHFREGETREVTVRFTPAGEPWGFRLRLPEDEPGPALPAGEARDLAEEAAEAGWGVELGRYELVESSQETRPGGRVDHTFVYLLSGVRIDEADVRLRLEVAGGELAEVTSFVRVPEAFSRRYAEMRTANLRIALVATLLFVVVFLVVGCGFGVFHLLRTRWLQWRVPLVWGAVVAGFMALATLNQLPLSWMDYDTALPASTFLMQQILVAAAILGAGTGFLAVIFMAAEGLGRRAFPSHPQQWRFWDPDVARSGPALGRTAGGYLVAALEIGFVVAFYLWAMRREGWWMPSEALIQPDLLATYFPWLTAVSVALFSGFWEESLFRAVPIAGAALLGARFGKRGWWIGTALVLQAAVFAAGHADYPQQPSYARLLELFLPALFWGVLYIWFGLVPVILAHASYNLTLISIPLWASSAPGIWMDRGAVILLGLVPLWIVLYHLARRGYRSELPEWARNAAWTPPPPGEGPEAAGASGTDERRAGEGMARPPAAVAGRGATAVEAGRPSGPAEPSPASPALRRLPALLGAAALLGGVLLLATWRGGPDAPRIDLDREEAEAIARDALDQRGLAPGPEWRTLSRVVGGPQASHRFVWEEGGREAYDALLGAYLPEPGWSVRFARFTGPVEERAEEFRVALDAEGALRRIEHRLPEDREGAALDEDEARALAEALLRTEFELDPAGLVEVSAVAAHRPNRRDWTFTWSDPAAYPLDRGEARVRIGLAGDHLSERHRFVHVPEEWEREREAVQSRLGILGGISTGLLLLVFVAGAVAGVVRWARGRFDVRAALAVAGATFLLFGLLSGNSLPTLQPGFTTTVGFREQLLIVAVGFGLVAAFMAVALGLNAGFVHRWRRDAGPEAAPPPEGGGAHAGPALVGIALGLLVAGLGSLALALDPRDLPRWPSHDGAGAYLPFLEAVPGPATQLLVRGLFVLLVLVAVDRFTGGWSRRTALAAAALLLVGIAAPGPGIGEEIWVRLLPGLVTGLGLYALFRLARVLPGGVAFVPWMVATVAALGALPGLLHPAYPGEAVGRLLALGLLLGMAWMWTGLLRRDAPSPT